MCEEFPCYGPEEAYRAWQRLPVGVLEDIIEGRRYREAKQAIDACQTAEQASRLPTGGMFALAAEVTERIYDEDTDGG